MATRWKSRRDRRMALKVQSTNRYWKNITVVIELDSSVVGAYLEVVL